MNTPPISSDHLLIAQRIIAFVQEQGWDIHTIHIERYVDHPFFGGLLPEAGEEWKAKVGVERKWAMNIVVGPRDEKELKERRLIGQ